MLVYFEHAASRLQVRGEYEKSTAGAQALEKHSPGTSTLT